MRNLIFLFAVSTMFFLTACGGEKSSSAAAETTTTETTEATPSTDSAVAEVEIHGDDNMKYDKSEIVVKEGQTVKLTLVHIGTQSVEAMGHNWVLLQPGTDVNSFATAAIAAKDNDYIPADMAGSVIAHTKTIGGGESTSIEFTAPDAGEYDFICTFPGHAAMMHGKLIVQ